MVTRDRRVHVATEVAVWFLLLVVIEHHGLGSGIGYVGVEPSPLWFPIVWASLRSGLFAGLAAALAAGLLHGVGYAADVGVDAMLIVAPAVLWPLTLFTGLAFLVGQARDTIAGEREHQRHVAENWKRKAKSQKQDMDLLRQVNRELKRRIFDRSFDFQSLMATVARSSDGGDERAFDAALGMLVDFCGARKCSVLYVLPGGVLDLAAHRGWSEDELRTRLLMESHERVLRAVVEARPIVALGDDDVEQGGALLVAPLADATGVIKAVLCIDDLPPARFDQATVKTFLGVAGLMAANLRRVEIGGPGDASGDALAQALDAGRTIGSPERLSERIFLDDARRTRHRVETVLVALRCLDVRGGMAEYVEAVEGHVGSVLDAIVRPADDVFRFGFAGCYVVVLTGCRPKEAAQLVECLREGFAAQPYQHADPEPDAGGGGAAPGGACLPVDLRLFAPDEDAPRLGALLPRITEYFFGGPVAGLDQRCPVPEPRAQRSGNAEDFAQRLRVELDLARRTRWELSLLDLRGEDESFRIGTMMARHLWNSVGTMLRVTDGIHVLGPNRCVVLLPCTTCEEARHLWERLDADLAASLPQELYKTVQVGFLALGSTDLRDALVCLSGAPTPGATSAAAAAQGGAG